MGICQTFGAILSTLVNGDDIEKSIQACGYLQSIEKFQFIVCLVILDYIFGTTKSLWCSTVVRTRFSICSMSHFICRGQT